MVKNVLGGNLQTCCTDPLTGFYRDGKCNSGVDDVGNHTVCVTVTDEFLRHCMMPSLRWIGPELVRSLTRDESPVLGAKA